MLVLRRPREEWKVVEEFPDYAVSNRGEVIRTARNIPMSQPLNQQGIPYVRFYLHSRQIVRSVAVLVAAAFLEPHEHEWFDTPTNINGDRLDNRVENLMWRPRWFAIKYHQQMKEGPLNNYISRPIMDEATEEIYSSPWEAAITLGLLEGDIVVGVFNKESVYPGGYMFCNVEDEYVDIN